MNTIVLIIITRYLKEQFHKMLPGILLFQMGSKTEKYWTTCFAIHLDSLFFYYTHYIQQTNQLGNCKIGRIHSQLCDKILYYALIRTINIVSQFILDFLLLCMAQQTNQPGQNTLLLHNKVFECGVVNVSFVFYNFPADLFFCIMRNKRRDFKTGCEESIVIFIDLTNV